MRQTCTKFTKNHPFSTRMVLRDPTLGRLQRTAAKLYRFAVDSRDPGFQSCPSESRTAWTAVERIRAEVRRRLGLRPRP